MGDRKCSRTQLSGFPQGHIEIKPVFAHIRRILLPWGGRTLLWQANTPVEKRLVFVMVIFCFRLFG